MAKPFMEVTGGNENGMKLLKQSNATNTPEYLAIWHRTYLETSPQDYHLFAIEELERRLKEFRQNNADIPYLSELLTLRFAMEDRGRLFQEWNNQNPSDTFIEPEPYTPKLEIDEGTNK